MIFKFKLELDITLYSVDDTTYLKRAMAEALSDFATSVKIEDLKDKEKIKKNE